MMDPYFSFHVPMYVCMGVSIYPQYETAELLSCERTSRKVLVTTCITTLLVDVILVYWQ